MFSFVDSQEWKPIDPSFNKELENSVLNKEDRNMLEGLFKETSNMLTSWRDDKLADTSIEITQGEIEEFSVKSLDLLSTIYNKLNFEIEWNIRLKNVEYTYLIEYILNNCIYKASDYSLAYGEMVFTYFIIGVNQFINDNNTDTSLFNQGKSEILCSLKWEVMRSLYELFNKWEITGMGNMKENEGAKLLLYVLAPLNRKFHALNKNYMFYLDEMNRLAEMRKNLINSSGSNRNTEDMMNDYMNIPSLVQG